MSRGGDGDHDERRKAERQGKRRFYRANGWTPAHFPIVSEEGARDQRAKLHFHCKRIDLSSDRSSLFLLLHHLLFCSPLLLFTFLSSSSPSPCACLRAAHHQVFTLHPTLALFHSFFVIRSRAHSASLIRDARPTVPLTATAGSSQATHSS